MDDNEIVADWPTTFGICCCCLSEGEYKDMMEEYVWIGEKEVYADMLQQCFDLIMMTIPEDDSKRLICEICVTRLRDASRFRIQVEDAQINYIDRMSTFRLSQTQQKQSTELKVEFDWQGGDSDDNYFDDPNFSHFKKTPDEDLDGEVDDKELVTKEVKKKAIKRKATKSKLKEVELTEEDIKAERDRLSKIEEIFNWTRRDYLIGSATNTTMTVKVETQETAIQWMTSEAEDVWKRHVSNLRQDTIIILAYTDICPFEWKSGKYMCTICYKEFSDITLLRVHMRSHNMRAVQEMCSAIAPKCRLKLDTTLITCKVCETSLPTLTALREHLQIQHEEEMTDEFEEGLMQFKLDKDAMGCQLCGQPFVNFMMLNRHMNTHYQNYICDVCGKTFATVNRFKVHSKGHTVGSYPCSRCGVVFDRQYKRENHFAKEHKKGLIFRCPHCNEHFHSYSTRLRHLAEVHDERKEYNCKACLRVFPSSSRLWVHVRRDHIKERKYQCKQCYSSFFSKKQLEDHEVKHGGDRKFVCEVCSKGYPRQKTLVEHMKIHTNDKRFICPECGRAFTQKCSLKGHMNTHRKANT